MTPDELARMIPDAVVEAAAHKQALLDGYTETWWDECVARFGADWGVLQRFRDDARAALAAGLAVWPNAFNGNTWPDLAPTIVLPLQESGK